MDTYHLEMKFKPPLNNLYNQWVTVFFNTPIGEIISPYLSLVGRVPAVSSMPPPSLDWATFPLGQSSLREAQFVEQRQWEENTQT